MESAFGYSDIPALNRSISSIFGRERYLESICDKLYAHSVMYGRDLSQITEAEFDKIVGRISKGNRERVKACMQLQGLYFFKAA